MALKMKALFLNYAIWCLVSKVISHHNVCKLQKNKQDVAVVGIHLPKFQCLVKKAQLILVCIVGHVRGANHGLNILPGAYISPNVKK